MPTKPETSFSTNELEQQRSMKTVTVSRADLIDKLTENRHKHQEEYEAAFTGWHQKVLATLADVAVQFNDTNDTTRLNVGYACPQPQNNTDDYDRALLMLEWEKQDLITLSEQDFRNLVQDDWDWTSQHRNFSAQYIAS